MTNTDKSPDKQRSSEMCCLLQLFFQDRIVSIYNFGGVVMCRRRHWYSVSTDSAGMTFPRLVSFDSAVWRIGRQGAAHAAILLGALCVTKVLTHLANI